MIDSVVRTGKKCYPQVYIDECKYVVKEINMPKYITDKVEVSSGEENSSEKNSDRENSDEQNYSEE